MDLAAFTVDAPGTLIPVHGTDPAYGDWAHSAFLPDPLPSETPSLSMPTMMAVADARAALSSLDSTARRLPNPALLRRPTLRREAQSTSALEGTYAPLSDVLVADEQHPATAELVEVLNYERMADAGFAAITGGRSLTLGMLTDLQGILMRGTPLASVSGRIRDTQVIVGRRAGAPAGPPVASARFVPPPPGLLLESSLRDLTEWMSADHAGAIDPVVAAALAHYQFESLHPFPDGNGRVGRFLIVVHLLVTGILTEPTLTVSPWFEARRSEYYDALLGVSTRGDWDTFITFFAQGLRDSALRTQHQMDTLVSVQNSLHDEVRALNLRADSNHLLVDFAIARPAFSVKQVASELALSNAQANTLVNRLVEHGILRVVEGATYDRRFYSPKVLEVLTTE